MMMNAFRCSLMAFLIGVSLLEARPQEDSQVTAKPDNPRTRSDSEQNKSADRPSPAQRYPRYLLRPSDVLQVTFPISPEFDQTVSIQPDGYIGLRGVGDLHIAGMTVPELIEALKKAYGQFLHDPIITVELKDFEKPYFIAGGQFGRPGKYELRGDTRVTEAVAIAGGFTEKAKHSDVVLYRRIPSGWIEAKRINVKQMLTSRDLSEDPYLRPGDLLYVPQSSISKIRQYIPNPGMGVGLTF
jgi:polysaccharide export outer membrane protein